MAFAVAVVGATGLVGEALLEQLAESGLPASDVVALASDQSAGKRLEYGQGWLKVEDLKTFDFSSAQVALLALPPQQAAPITAQIADAGCVAVDLSGVWLADPSVPVALPGVLEADVMAIRERNLVAVPGAAAAMAARFLAPLQQGLRAVSVDLSVLYPAAIAGRAGVEELAGQTARLLGSQQPEPGLFPGRLAFSLVSTGRAALGNGPLAADASTELALGRLFPGSPLLVGSQSVVLPEFFGLAVGVVVHGQGQLDTASALATLARAGLEAEAEQEGSAGTNLVEGLEPVSLRVSGLRCAGGDGTRLQAWLSADMVRGCAGRNGVQIAELLLKDYS